MTSATPVSGGDKPWLIHLSTRRPDPGTVARVALAEAGRCSTLTMVVKDDDLTIQVLELHELPPGEVRQVGLRHVQDLEAVLTETIAAAPGPVVLAAVDRVAQLVSWGVAQEMDHVVVTNSLDAALRVLATMHWTTGVDDVLHPPGFSVALSVADAGVGCSASSDTLVKVDQDPSPSDAPWLMVRDQDLAAWTHGMSRWAARAVTARQGRRRRVAEDVPRRLLLGPANYAGQGGEWARAVREHAPGWTARNMHVVPPHSRLVFGADLPMTSAEWAEPAARLDFAIELVVGATDVVVEAMRPLLGVGDASDSVNAWDIRRGREDVDALRSSGRNVALLFHGSEVRRPLVHARLTPWSPFHRWSTEALTASLERTTDLVHELLADFDGPVLVSTPDLLDYIPRAVWLPGVVGKVSFVQTTPALAGRRPVIAHAPSRSWLKGSEWVDPVLQRMEQQGLLTYRRVSDLPPVMIPSLLREVDVVIDQVVLGNPGVLAAQAMAAGRLVIAHLPEAVRQRFPDPPPVVEANPETIEQVLLSVIENPEHYSQIASRGVGFARKYHDGRMSARVLTEVLGS